MVVDNIIKSLSPKPTVNYRSNLHVHIRVPGLSDDVQAIKKAMRYVELHGQRAFDLVDPLPEKPEKGTPEMVRWRRRKQSHQNMLTTEQYANVYHSNSTEQIKLAHVISYSVDGTPQWQFVQRCGVNFLSLWKHDTIEFRHFCGTLSLFEMYFSLLWCRQFLIAALQDHKMTPDSIYGSWGSHIEYPKQPLLSRWHEERYRLTSPRYNSDSEILAQIEFYREEGTL
jgi:hypothetical protein